MNSRIADLMAKARQDFNKKVGIEESFEGSRSKEIIRMEEIRKETNNSKSKSYFPY